MDNIETVQQQLAAMRENQERLQDLLGSDPAYQYSVKNDDIINMMLVLEAHEEPCTFSDADLQLRWGQTVALVAEYNKG